MLLCREIHHFWQPYLGIFAHIFHTLMDKMEKLMGQNCLDFVIFIYLCAKLITLCDDFTIIFHQLHGV